MAVPIFLGLVLSASLIGCPVFAEEHLPRLPAKVTLDRDACAHGLLLIPLHFAGGPELLFIIDTGSPLTIVDRSLNPRLGKKTARFHLRAWEVKQTAGVYPAPRLFLGETPLVTGSNILSCDFRKFSKHFERQVRGILGMDCLQHYRLQLDFAAGEMRFLDHVPEEASVLGKSFPLIYSNVGQTESNLFRSFINHSGLLGTGGTNLLIDTGLDLDGGVAPHHLSETNALGRDTVVEKLDPQRWYLSKTRWEGNVYTNLLLRPAPSAVAGPGANVLGLRFLARHLVTFDFPGRTMYLRQQLPGPPPLSSEDSLELVLPKNGRLPADIEARLGELMGRVKPPLSVRWFGGVISVKKHGEPAIFKFSVSPKQRKGGWKLKKAWREDPEGRTLETYPVANQKQ